MKDEDPGVKSWPPDAWKIGDATAWSWFKYDPDLDLIYYGRGRGTLRSGR